MKKYEGLYIFAGAAKDDVLDKQIDKARGEITRLGGAVIDTEIIGKKMFARIMKKRDNGTYVKIRFELAPTQVKTLIGRYHLSEDVFRVQILAIDERREQRIAGQIERQKAREAARVAAAEQERAEAEAAEIQAEEES